MGRWRGPHDKCGSCEYQYYNDANAAKEDRSRLTAIQTIPPVRDAHKDRAPQALPVPTRRRRVSSLSVEWQPASTCVRAVIHISLTRR
jgi:hypothetical protein